jgi:hypothetical protein
MLTIFHVVSADQLLRLALQYLYDFALTATTPIFSPDPNLSDITMDDLTHLSESQKDVFRVALMNEKTLTVRMCADFAGWKILIGRNRKHISSVYIQLAVSNHRPQSCLQRFSFFRLFVI